MARTWSLFDTPSLGGSYVENGSGFIAQNSSKSKVFFFDSTGKKVWSWETDKTLTDISGTTFTAVADYKVVDIAWFKGDLYVAYIYSNSPSLYAGKIAKWAGTGQTWTDMWTLTDGTYPGKLSPGTYYEYLDADNDQIFVVAYYPAPASGPQRIAGSSNGIGWVLQKINGSTTKQAAFDFAYGFSKGSGYADNLAEEYLGNVISFDGIDDWTDLGTKICSMEVLGYGDGYSFFRAWGVTCASRHWLVKSTDWGATYTTAGISGMTSTTGAAISIRQVASDALMMCYRNNNVQAYTFDGSDFVTDGSIPTGTHYIRSFFRLGNKMYALCASASTGECKIYQASGTVLTGTDRFYQGVNMLTERSNTPFIVQKVEGMAIDDSQGKAFLANEADESEKVGEASSGDSYGNWTDITDTLPSDGGKSLRRIK